MELPENYYALYDPETKKFGCVFSLPEGKVLTDGALDMNWRIMPLTLIPAIPLPTIVAPPISLVTELATNENAQWPFPQLKKTNPDPPRRAKDVKYITIHHSAGKRATTNITYWHKLHTQSKSWSRCGYHLCIGALESGGEIGLYEVNPYQYVSWHDARNYDTYGVTFAGDLRALHDFEPNEAQLECFGRAMAYALPMFTELKAIMGHKYWQATACPGDLERWYPLLVDAAKQYGCDIAGLLKFKPAIKARLAQAFQLQRRGPPLEDYEDV